MAWRDVPNGSGTVAQAGAGWALGAKAVGKWEPMGGRGWQDSYSAFRECEAELLSEKLEQRAGKKTWSRFSKKNKSCPRKEINHSTLCALSENSVYIVLMLNMDLTKIGIWVCCRNVGQNEYACVWGVGIESFSSISNPANMECRLTGCAGVSVCVNSCGYHNSPPRQGAIIPFTVEKAEAQRAQGVCLKSQLKTGRAGISMQASWFWSLL